MRACLQATTHLSPVHILGLPFPLHLTQKVEVCACMRAVSTGGYEAGAYAWTRISVFGGQEPARSYTHLTVYAHT